MKYFFIRQHDITDCGAACIATISKQFGLNFPIAKIRKIAGTDKAGTNALGLIKASEKLGFDAKGVRAEPEDLNEKLPLPCIAHVIKDDLLHYVVIHKITKKKMIIADPAEGLVHYKKEDFLKIWTGVLILMMPSESFKKGSEKIGFFERFLSLLYPHKKLMTEIIISSFLLSLMGMLGAFFFKYLIDEVFISGLLDSLHIVAGGMMILTVFRIILGAFRQHLLVYLTQKIDISLVFSYYRHVLKLPISFFDSRRTGEILSRLNDASKIQEAVSGVTLSVILDSTMVVGAGIILYLQSSTLFLISLILVPFSAVILFLFVKPFQQRQRQVMTEAADTESQLVESVSGIATVKAVNGERQAVEETEKFFLKTVFTSFRIAKLENIQGSLQDFITAAGGLMILWIGGVLVIKGQISIGQLITFNALLAYFHEPIQNLIGLQPALQEAFVAAERLGEILDLEIESPDEDLMKPECFTGAIDFQNVTFRYGTREEVISDFSLKIHPGEKIAVVGESGSGKTTLVKMLFKYYVPEKGKISIDGLDLRDLDTENLRSRIGYVPQDIVLFSGSVRDNIAYGNREASFESIVRAAELAQAHGFINELPLRYRTKVGERGATLSGGQRQRIALARAILNNPQILILDEATSSLDSISERAIHNTIDELSRDITTIIIAHRLSTVVKCDKIVVMEKGEIREWGTHQELIDKGERYGQLWQSQCLV
ncbi:peptidase domain-containing ABC transporter [Spirochaeta isovalerica]|uniref:ATP-binding cassette subfamily B protein n=1 Tax=Spirochaeta isovalerica TaxID=150 RepID=A0A841R9I1_9SPIO|nr:peptidase domain-containing ABC transporter [Spirochaeta isovalerica]MBB6479599.1 ATP-binding cassette subfamily B protein [Spirochaeta isovalerica]